MVKHNDNVKLPIVLLITQLERAGAQKVALMLARYLYGRGYPVKLVFFYDKAGIITELQRTEPYPVINLAAKQMGASRLSNIGRTLLALGKLFRLFRTFQTSAVITFTHYSNVLGIFLAWAARVPVRIASQHNVLYRFPAWFLKVDAWIANSFLTSRMVAVSDTIARFCIEQEGMRPEKVSTIRNGIVVQKFSTTDAVRQAVLADIRTQWHIPEDAFLIATVARLHPQKGHPYLIEAAAKVVKHHANVVFLIIGDGETREYIETLINTSGLANHFRLLGTRSDVPTLLEIMNLFVLPSLYEGLPISLLEAMAARVPVIATTVGGVPEVVTNGITGVLVDPGDANQLSQAMDMLVSNSDYRDRLAQAAYAHVCDHFSSEAMTLAYEALLLDLLKRIGLYHPKPEAIEKDHDA